MSHGYTDSDLFVFLQLQSRLTPVLDGNGDWASVPDIPLCRGFAEGALYFAV
jgi:hypothetical protein